MACVVSAFVSNISADASSELISCCSLAFFFFSSSIWSDTAFLFLSDSSASAFFLWLFKVQVVFLSGITCSQESLSTSYINLVNATHILTPTPTSHDRISWQLKSQPADELLQLACLLKSLFLQLLDRVKEQATFWQCSTTCCTYLCQPWSHASGHPLWTWLTKRSCSLSIMEAAYSECWNNHHGAAHPSMSIALSTSWRHFERFCTRIHAVLRPRHGAEGRALLYGAMSALVDLPGVANLLEDDWWLFEDAYLRRPDEVQVVFYVFTDHTMRNLLLLFLSHFIHHTFALSYFCKLYHNPN